VPLLTRDYQCLLRLYQERNVTRAALKLGMQQPGLSKILTRLEAELGRKLFGRNKGGLIPTPFAEKLVREVRELQDRWDSRYRELLDHENLIEGEFKIGCHPVLAETYLVAKYVQLKQEFPELNLELTLRRSIEVTELVADGGIDFGLVASPVHHPDLVARKVGREHVALWSNGELTRGNPVYFNPEMIQINRVLAHLKGYRGVPIPDYQLIRSLVQMAPRQGAILPSPMALQTKGLTQCSKSFYWTDVSLIYRADIAKTRAVRKIISTIASGD
jgi:LysR family transcriptional regulator, cell division regulator